jgi:hypothetical protein
MRMIPDFQRSWIPQGQAAMTFEEWTEEVAKARTLPIDVKTDVPIRCDDAFVEEQEEE